MAVAARPESLLIPSDVFDGTKFSNPKSLPTLGHSSSSSIDSASGNHVNIHQQNMLRATTSSTTTDSDLESEQDENLHLTQEKKDSNASDRSTRRKKHFDKLFKSEIPGDMPEIIDSYVCAYQGDILLQGKMYITDRYLCFHSRIINYVTKHVYRWEQIECVSKERVAFIFPTAIGIQLKKTGKKVTYASFLQRDQACEKILSIWSRFHPDSHSYNGDDDNDLPHDGTLKAHHRNDRNSRDPSDMNEATGQEVLQLYLKQSQQGRTSLKQKHSDEKQLTKKSERKSSAKNSNENMSHNNQQTTRNARYTKHEQKSSEKTKGNHRSPSQHRDRTFSQPDQIVSHSNPSPNIQSTALNSNPNGILNKLFSCIQRIYQLFSVYPMKTTIIIFLVLTILFLHSFYLIKLAYRIETRLQSLYHLWPSSSSSSMKNSVSSNTKDL